MEIARFQAQIAAIYGDRDRRRGAAATFQWFVEEVGELARALRGKDRRAVEEEFSDVLAWLVTLADLHGVDMAHAAARYTAGCPKCRAVPCACPEEIP